MFLLQVALSALALNIVVELAVEPVVVVVIAAATIEQQPVERVCPSERDHPC